MRALALAALALAASPAGAQQLVLQPGETLLEVEAEGIVRAVPDRATFSTEVSSDGGTPDAAMQANAVAAQRLVSAMLAAGVAQADLRTSDIRTGRRFRRNSDGDHTDEVIGYRASERFEVRVPAGRASAVLDALGKAGATEINGPSFSVKDAAPLDRAARAKAVAEANARADDYAAALGLRRSRILRVSERSARRLEGSDIVVTGSKRVAAPLAPGEQETTTTVWIDYALAK